MEKVHNKWRIFAIFLIALLVLETALLIILPTNNKEGDTNIQLTPATIRGKVLTDLGEMLLANIIVEDSTGATSLYTTNFQIGRAHV
jgi:hypothetical protein